MPITATLGALTYQKFGLGTAQSKFWLIKFISGIGDIYDGAWDTTGNIYIWSERSAGTLPQITKFDSIGLRPIYNKSFDLNLVGGGAEWVSDGAITYDSYSNSVVGVSNNRILYTGSFPNYFVINGWSYVTDPAFNSSTSVLNSPAPPNPSANNNSRKIPYACIVNPSNGYFIQYGLRTDPATGDEISIYYDQSTSSAGTTINSQSQTSFITSTVTLTIGNIKILSGGDPVLLFTCTDLSTPANTRIVLRRANQTRTGIGPFFLPNVWQRQLKLDRYIVGTDLAVDSSDNIALVGNNTNTDDAYIVYYNSSGAIQWQRQFANTVLNAVTFDASGNVYISGTEFLAKYNSSGTLQWQIEVTGTTDVVNMSIVQNRINVVGIDFMYSFPITGTIPGQPTGSGVTFSIGSRTESSGTLTDSNNTTDGVAAGVCNLATNLDGETIATVATNTYVF